jgi:hypothetical protein
MWDRCVARSMINVMTSISTLLKEFPASLMVADGNPSAFSQIQKA